MAYSFGHAGGSVPLRLQLEQTQAQAPCPACQRLDLEGTVRLTVSASADAGSVAAMCERGHMTFVNWAREDTGEGGDEPPVET